MQNIWLDLRYACRALFRVPLFAAVAICSMAVGIGANTAVFSVFNAVLLRPFPYQDPDALVALAETPGDRGGRFTISPPDFLLWRASASTLQSAAAYRAWTPNLTGIEQAERLDGLRVSGDFFSVLGVAPIVGNSLVRDDETRGNRVVVISDALWHRLFAADPTVVGRTLRLNGEGYVVAGVMPRTLQFPYREVEIWAPLNLDREQQDRGEHSLLAVARLKAGASVEQARAELRTLTFQHESESNGHIPAISRLRDWFVGPSNRTTLWALMGAVGLLLLAACTNVANLLLARGRVRGREFMIRTAIGATRGRLIAQLVTESLALSVIAGALGLLLALWSVEALLGMLPAGSPYRMTPTAVDWRVLAYTLVLSLAAALLFGILPALRHSRTQFNAGHVDPRSSAFRTQGILLVAQTALAVTLLLSAGLLTRGFLTLWQIDPGFSADGVMTARVTLPSARPDEQTIAFFERALQQLSADPNVIAAAAVTHAPLSGLGNSGYFTIEGRESLADSPSTQPGAARFIVTADYFRTLGIPIRDGRSFTTDDVAGAPGVAVINEAMRRMYWENQSPIGRRIKRGTPAAKFPWLTIVGVVPDVRQQGLGAVAVPTVYLALPQSAESSMTFVVKSNLSNTAAATRIRSAVRAIDRNQPVALVRSLDEMVFGSVSGRWLPTMWMSVFAGLALILAVFGVHGVVSYAVEQRRREFGIRLALGASRADVIRLAVRQGAVPAMIGTALGICAGPFLARLNSAFFAGAPSIDVATFALATGLLALVTLVAAYAPARKISIEDAALTLRAE